MSLRYQIPASHAAHCGTVPPRLTRSVSEGSSRGALRENWVCLPRLMLDLGWSCENENEDEDEDEHEDWAWRGYFRKSGR
jgi:hypothetical protein